MFMELFIYTVGTYIMYYLDCKAIRVKIGKVMFRSQSEWHQWFDFKSAKYSYDMLLYYPGMANLRGFRGSEWDQPTPTHSDPLNPLGLVNPHWIYMYTYIFTCWNIFCETLVELCHQAGNNGWCKDLDIIIFDSLFFHT